MPAAWLVLLLLPSRPGEFHPRALPEPCVNLSTHTAPDVQPLKCIDGFASVPELLPLPVGSEPRLNNASAKIVSRKGNSRRVWRSRTRRAPSRSCRSAGCTTMARTRPRASTRRWRFLPVTFLPASVPGGSMRAPFCRAFLALAVDHPGTRRGLAAFRLPDHEVARVMDPLQRAVPVPQHLGGATTSILGIGL